MSRYRPRVTYNARRPTARYLLPGGTATGPRHLWGDPAAAPGVTGPGAPGSPAVPESVASYYEQVGQFVGGYTSSQDVRVKLEIAKAELASIQKQLATTPPMLASLLGLNGRLAKKDAEVRALTDKLAVQLRAEGETNQWHTLGQTGLGIGIVGGVVAVGVLAILGAKLIKGRPSEPAERRENPRRKRRRRV